MSFNQIMKRIQLSFKYIWHVRPFWIRLLFAWVIGIAFLLNDVQTNYDLRFKVRGQSHQPTDIVLVLISDAEWKLLKATPVESIKVSKNITSTDTLTDNIFWDENIWAQFLEKLLQLSPQKIGISFFFGKNLGADSLKTESRIIFNNHKIYWAAVSDSQGKYQLPLVTQNNYGIINLTPDSDGTVRRIPTPTTSLSHLGLRLANTKLSDVKGRIINYQGGSGTFRSVSLTDVLKDRVNPEWFKNKIVIVGSKDAISHQLATPYGFMSKSEVLANVVDNSLNKRWILHLPLGIYLGYFFLLILLSALIVIYYPPNLALALTAAIIGTITSISTWVFDQFYIWIPILSMMTQILAVYIIFVGYKLSQNERKSWRLEQERHYLFELEKLKNNFISLFSHDLKTPLAKIQGITDRLMLSSVEEKVKADLTNLKSSSQDLQKYIQSILHVSRIEASDFKVNREPQDLNEIIENVVNQVRPLADEKNIKIEYNLEPLFSVEIDAHLIHEVIVNLLENAIKYTQKGGSVFIKSNENENQIQFMVSDTGDGIPPAEMEHIWEKFYRGEKHNLTTKGTGLGLYLVKYFVELHGGNVFINSKVGQGTDIGFKLPLSSH